MITNLEAKLTGKIPVNREELVFLIDSWGRKKSYNFNIRGLKLNYKKQNPTKCYNLSNLDVSQITNMDSIFYSSSYNGDLSKWNLSNVTHFTAMFAHSKFNNNSISNWNTSNVIDISYLFCNSKFNCDISKWNTSKCTKMIGVFNNSKFKGSISNWDVSNVINMCGLFANYNFIQDLSSWNFNTNVNLNGFFYQRINNKFIDYYKFYNWNLLNLEDIEFTLLGYKELNNKIIVIDNTILHQIIKDEIIPLEKIDIKKSKLKDLSFLFYRTSRQNYNISNWDISEITIMQYTFSDSKFNGDLSKWDVSNVTNMSLLFYKSKFNNDSISKWNVSNVKNMKWMFAKTLFNGDISRWKFNKDSDFFCYNIFYMNENFKDKYNNGEDLPYNSKEFLEWFETNRKNIGNLNISNEDKIYFDNYLISFNIYPNHFF